MVSLTRRLSGSLIEPLLAAALGLEAGLNPYGGGTLARVFLSYAQEDEHWAQRIEKEIEKAAMRYGSRRDLLQAGCGH